MLLGFFVNNVKFLEGQSLVSLQCSTDVGSLCRNGYRVDCVSVEVFCTNNLKLHLANVGFMKLNDGLFVLILGTSVSLRICMSAFSGKKKQVFLHIIKTC